MSDKVYFRILWSIRIFTILAWIVLLVIVYFGVPSFKTSKVEAAAPPISTTLSSGFNAPQYVLPPEFCGVQKFAITNASTTLATTDGVKGYGQQFTPSSNYTVCKIYVHIAKGGVPAGTFTVALMTDNPTGSISGNPCPSGVMYSASIPFASLQAEVPFASADASIPMYKIDITPTALTSGTRYWVVCFDPQGSVFSGNYMTWYEWGPSIAVTANQSYTISATFPPAAWDDYNDNTQFRLELKGD